MVYDQRKDHLFLDRVASFDPFTNTNCCLLKTNRKCSELVPLGHNDSKIQRSFTSKTCSGTTLFLHYKLHATDLPQKWQTAINQPIRKNKHSPHSQQLQLLHHLYQTKSFQVYISQSKCCSLPLVSGFPYCTPAPCLRYTSKSGIYIKLILCSLASILHQHISEAPSPRSMHQLYTKFSLFIQAIQTTETNWNQ